MECTFPLVISSWLYQRPTQQEVIYFISNNDFPREARLLCPRLCYSWFQPDMGLRPPRGASFLDQSSLVLKFLFLSFLPSFYSSLLHWRFSWHFPSSSLSWFYLYFTRSLCWDLDIILLCHPLADVLPFLSTWSSSWKGWLTNSKICPANRPLWKELHFKLLALICLGKLLVKDYERKMETEVSAWAPFVHDSIALKGVE